MRWSLSVFFALCVFPAIHHLLSIARHLKVRQTTILLLASAVALPAAAQSGQWTWMSGASNALSGQNGVYGTLGVPAPANVPGARALATSWTDNNGNLWLFGGSAGATGTNSSTHFNDLWEFNTSTNQWVWMSGRDNSVPGLYGTQGVPASANVPGARQAAMGWSDSAGNIWLFGGWGYDSVNTFGDLNDLWKFDPGTKQWTWVSGASTLPGGNNACSPAVYGTLGVASPSNIPGGRQFAASWTDSSGKFWLFGGPGCDSNGTQGLLNDLWKYDPVINQWTWMGGGNQAASGTRGTYGAQGVPAANNIPGGRWNYDSGSWADANGNLWLFGGEGYDSLGARGYLNDLWKFTPATNQWTWVSGSSTVGTDNCYQPRTECAQSSAYGALGQPAPGNVPGGRIGAVGATDSKGNVWVFGGRNNPAGIIVELNDLWKFNPQTNQWAWIAGSNAHACGVTNYQGTCLVDGHSGVYGTSGVPAAANVPGSRSEGVAWNDKNGNLWIFGGSGLDSTGTLLPLNDLWKFQVGQSSTVALTSSANPVFAQNSVTLTASITSTGGTPTGAVTFLDGTTVIGTSTLNSSSATLSSSTLAVGSHAITSSYSGDTNFLPASALLTQVVEDFSITPGSTTSASVNAGGSATYTFTVNPVGPATKFPSSLTLAASGGPAGTTYSFSPSSIAAGAASTSVTLTVVVPSNVGSLRDTVPWPAGPLSLPLAIAACLVPLIRRPSKARKRRPGIALIIMIVFGIAASASLGGCSSGTSTTTKQPQSYTITIVGTAGVLTHSTAVTLHVN